MDQRRVESFDLGVLSGVAPELASAFASLGSDIALVIDGDGVIRNVAVGGAAVDHPARDWVGKSWSDTVTGETKRKIDLLLEEVGTAGATRRREVNHPSGAGDDIPVSYAALRLGAQGPVIAVGRDLRAVAAIQQRFVDAQKEMERDYWQLRRDAAHQRLLAQVSSDAVMVVDAATFAVLEANAAAIAMFGAPGATLPAPVTHLLETAARSGKPAEVRSRLEPRTEAPQRDVSAAPFRVATADGSVLRLLLRARDATVDGTSPAGEAVAIVDSAGCVLAGNAAFLALCRHAPDRIQGQPLADLLGDPERHLVALLAEVRRDGLVQRPVIVLGGGGAPRGQAQVRAALLNDGDQECFGLSFVPARPGPLDDLAGALSSLLDAAGELPLEELVRRASEFAERRAIEVALRRFADDVAQAAQALGLTVDELAGRRHRLGQAG